MSNLYRRNGNIFKANSSDATDPDFAASYTVTAYEVGAVVNGAQTGVGTVTVRAGHGFAAGDYFIVGTDTTKFKLVDSVTSTTVVLDGASTVTVADKDYLVNLGTDGGSSAPAYDGSGVSIYDEPSGAATAVSNSRVTCDAQGGYGYWHDASQVWELVRDGDGTPVEVIPDVTAGVTGPASGTDNAVVRFDGTSGKVIQDSGVTIDDSNNLDVPGTLTVDGVSTQTGATTQTGKLTCAGEVEIDGALNHDGSTAGFYGVTPATRPAAITQTYSTADATHAARTAEAITDNSGGTASQTLAAITGGGAGCENATKNAVASLADDLNKLRNDQLDTAQLLNDVIDKLQTLGLLQ